MGTRFRGLGLILRAVFPILLAGILYVVLGIFFGDLASIINERRDNIEAELSAMNTDLNIIGDELDDLSEQASSAINYVDNININVSLPSFPSDLSFEDFEVPDFIEPTLNFPIGFGRNLGDLLEEITVPIPFSDDIEDGLDDLRDAFDNLIAPYNKLETVSSALSNILDGTNNIRKEINLALLDIDSLMSSVPFDETVVIGDFEGEFNPGQWSTILQGLFLVTLLTFVFIYGTFVWDSFWRGWRMFWRGAE